jgi:hypothetical protein
VPFLRHARDKRGYETTFVMHSFRPGAGQANGRTRLLYMFRTPSNRKVGRNLLDPEVMEALEHTHPDLTFDWISLLRTPALTAPDPDRERSDRDRERDRDRGRQRRDERRERQSDARKERDTAPAAQAASAVILEDDSVLGRTVGAAEAARLRAAFSELTQRIVRRSRTPEERDRLSERAARLNPDEWADETAIKDGASQFGAELEAIRQELPRRRRGRRGGRSRDREGAPSTSGGSSTGPEGESSAQYDGETLDAADGEPSEILRGGPSDIIDDENEHQTEREASPGADDPGLGDRLGAGDDVPDAGDEPANGGEIH